MSHILHAGERQDLLHNYFNEVKLISQTSQIYKRREILNSDVNFFLKGYRQRLHYLERCHVYNSILGLSLLFLSNVYKWKNPFSEMKGDAVMSHHEKEGEQEDAYTKTEIHS